MASTATRVVLVRHGESEWNAAGRIQGQGGAGLSEMGHRQAKAASEYLRGRYPDVSAIVRSDLERVVETAQPFEAVRDVDVTVDVRWREIDVGTWSGLTWAEVAEQDPTTLAAWRGGEDVRRGGGETFAELRERTSQALHGLRDVGGTVVVFTHGGCIRLGVAEAIGIPLMGEAALTPVANCSVTELLLDGDRRELSAYNVRDHLSGL